MKKIIVILVCFFCYTLPALAQCPMCKASVESNMADGNQAAVGNGLNTGILYLMAAPYIMVIIIGLLWYRSKKKQENSAPRFS